MPDRKVIAPLSDENMDGSTVGDLGHFHLMFVAYFARAVACPKTEGGRTQQWGIVCASTILRVVRPT